MSSTSAPQSHTTTDLRQALHQFQIDEYLCDTELVADNGRVKAHAVILAATSSVFKGALKPDSNPEERTIVLPGIELYLLEIAVRYAYTGEIMVPKQYMTADCLSVVVNVLEQLGFELTSITSIGPDATEVSTIYESGAESSVKHDEVDEDETNGVEITLNHALHVSTDKGLSSDHFDYCNKSSGKSSGRQINAKKEIKSGSMFKVSSKNTRIQNLPKADEKKNKVFTREPSQNVDAVMKVVSAEHASLNRPRNGVPSDAATYSNLCDICGEVFNDFKIYRAHKMKLHRTRKKDLPVQCQLCGISFANRPNLRRHMYQHTGERPHLCQHCGEGFIQRKSLQDHVTSRHPDKVDRDCSITPYQCRKCGEKLFSSYSYRRHMKLNCKELIIEDQLDPGTLPARDTVTKPYACEKCGRRFALKASVIIHSRLHTDEWAFQMGRRETRYGRSKADNVCRTCGKKFNFHATLVAHERTHTGEKPFKCTFCSLAVATACQLHAHVLRHTGETPHSCSVCGKGFRLRANLLSHERTHTGEKPFTCPDCGRQLAHAAQLIDHMRIHTGEKPYECKLCGKQMRQRAHLTTHMRTHTGERPYKCKLCEKSYKQIADLRFHYRRMHQYELPKNPDRRPFNVDVVKVLTSVDDQSISNFLQ